MIQKYSLAIQPNEPVLSMVTEMKQLLNHKIGHYGSVNSLAHISLFEFELEEEKRYPIVLSYCKRIIAGLAPFYITFKGFGHFTNPTKKFTYYVKVEESVKEIVSYCKQIKKGSPYTLIDKYKTPHMSIGRKLTQEKLGIASALLTDFYATDFCETFVIRKFNNQRGQYDIEEVIPLLNDKQGSSTQLNLF